MGPVLSRRNIRKYTKQPVTKQNLQTLLRAAMVAPSTDDQRPWHFIVIEDRQLLEQVSKIYPHAHMVNHAPLAILVCGDQRLQKVNGFWCMDCAAATQNILIEAQQLGLGTVCLGIHPLPGRVESFRRLFKTPEHVVPFALVPVGHPAEQKEAVQRYDESRVHRDYW